IVLAMSAIAIVAVGSGLRRTRRTGGADVVDSASRTTSTHATGSAPETSAAPAASASHATSFSRTNGEASNGTPVVSGFSRTGAAGFGRGLHFFFLGAGFMLLETKSIVQFALLWGSTWSSASLAIASVLVMALASVFVVSRVEIRRAAPL